MTKISTRIWTWFTLNSELDEIVCQLHISLKSVLTVIIYENIGNLITNCYYARNNCGYSQRFLWLPCDTARLPCWFPPRRQGRKSRLLLSMTGLYDRLSPAQIVRHSLVPCLFLDTLTLNCFSICHLEWYFVHNCTGPQGISLAAIAGPGIHWIVFVSPRLGFMHVRIFNK